MTAKKAFAQEGPSAALGTAEGGTPAPSGAPYSVTLKAAFLAAFVARSARLAALKAEAKALEQQLDAEETQILGALELGATHPGYSLNVVRSSRVNPPWKAIALAQAQAQGIAPDVFEAQIRADTPPSISTKLVISATD